MHLMPWARYSKKLISAVMRPQHVGVLRAEDADLKGMRLVVSRWGSEVALFLLIDEEDGVIADVKFQAFAPSALIGALEATCHLLVRKTVLQMSRLTTDLIDRQLRDKTDTPAFPEEMHSYLNVALEAVEGAVVECRDLLEKEVGPATPVGSCESEQWPGWEFLGKEEKLAVIEGVIAADIRPYIELDAGGVQVIDLVGGKELVISYQGACTTCYSSTGATLQAIQGILQAKVSAELVVVPDFS